MKKLLFRVSAAFALLMGSVAAYAQGTVSGTVKDASGAGVIGASVFVMGTHNGVSVMDIDGAFTLSGANAGDKIEVSCIGYSSQVVDWDGASPIDVVLAEDSEMLEGTVVTALGIRKDEKKVGYAVSSVSAASLNSTVAPSLGSALYGKASGVRITSAPGGAAGAISIQVRGISSLTGSNQPLVVVDGVPIRNGDANSEGYYGQARIKSNGLADINVEDIENLTILKGASATSLYGSEGANGVVLITMKQGKRGSGVHVDVGASVQGDFVAYMPKYQTTFGPGPRVDVVDGNSAYIDGGFKYRTNRDGEEVLGVEATNLYFGPKYDGRQVYYFDGTMRSYNAISANPWKEVYRTGLTQQYNVAITAGTDKGNTRFSYTFFDNIANQYNSHLGKHTFALSGSQNITANGAVKLGYSVNYMNKSQHNAPYRLNRVLCNFSGMFGAFEDLAYLRDHTVVKGGYVNEFYDYATHASPEEGWAYEHPIFHNTDNGDLIHDFLYRVLAFNQYETQNRVIASVSPSWEIIKGLSVKANVATDFTSAGTRDEVPNSVSPAFNPKSGSYSYANNHFTTVYGDAMVSYSTKFSEKVGLDANVGYSVRSETERNVSASTEGGLAVENWFHINASIDRVSVSEKHTEYLKQAVFGTASLSYGGWGYLEGTIRNEKVSSLMNGRNSYWYPSVNGSVVFSELLQMPKWWDFAKARVSYGIVGNAPEKYKAPTAYTQNTVYNGSKSGYSYNIVSESLNNDNLKPETTYEWEFGLESKFLRDRVGFEASYYMKRIADQILEVSNPHSSGAGSMWMNVGELRNKGLEFNIYGTPLETKDWTLNLNFNMAWNTGKVTKLAPGIDRLEHRSIDQGAAFLYSNVGEKIGSLYAYAPQTTVNGDYVVGSDGFYVLTEKPVKVGNALADCVGGFSISLAYKRVKLDANFNYQIGGDVLNLPYEYLMGRGSLVESMKYRDAEHGGLTYYFDAAGNCVPTSAAQGPNGEKVYDNGMVLNGVNENGETNTTMINADKFYHWTYNWGVGDPTYYSHAIFKNTYVKCREITLTYTFPEKLLKGWGCSGLSVSAFARNPFYVYKNLPIFDVEASDATDWQHQAVLEGSSVSTRTFGFSVRASF